MKGCKMRACVGQTRKLHFFQGSGRLITSCFTSSVRNIPRIRERYNVALTAFYGLATYISIAQTLPSIKQHNVVVVTHIILPSALPDDMLWKTRRACQRAASCSTLNPTQTCAMHSMPWLAISTTRFYMGCLGKCNAI